jgi:hypothetical protein
LAFEFNDAFSDSVKRAAERFCLLLERIELIVLVDRRRRGRRGWCGCDGLRFIGCLLPAWDAGGAKPVSPAASSPSATTISSTARSAASRTTDETSFCFPSAETCCASCHWAHSSGACSVSSWHDYASFL